MADAQDAGGSYFKHIQALQYRIWNLGPSSKKLLKGKIWDFGTKLGLFWDHFYTLLGLLFVIFIKMPQNLQKAKKALKPCSHDV